jgi:hypothetical protein
MSALWFPGSDLSHRAPTDGGTIVGGKPKLLWHDTETDGLPSYSTGSFPHMTVCSGKPFGHIPANRAARALKNPSGGVETNRWNVFQIEVCGFANKVKYFPVMTEIAEWARDELGVPMRYSVKWISYDASFGGSNGVRLSPLAWQTYTGHLGHMHAPENVHGDPGWPFPIDRILAKDGDDMTEEQARQLEAVYKGLIAQGTTSPNATIDIIMARVRNNERYIGLLCEKAGIEFSPVDTSQFS